MGGQLRGKIMTKLNTPEMNEMCKKLNKGLRDWGKPFPKSLSTNKENNDDEVEE